MRQYGSPLYVYRAKVLIAQYKRLKRAISYKKTRIFYACKANSNIEILKLLRRLGASIECVSRDEVERTFKAGFPASRISYTCSYIPRSELEWLIKKGISVHLDSLTQLTWWGEMNPDSKILIRINRGFGAGSSSHIITGGPESKFGIYYTDIPRAKAIAKKYRLKIVGLEQHIGSNIMDPRLFIRGMKLLLKNAREFPELRFLNFGGGIGIPYRPGQKSVDVNMLGKDISKLFADFCKNYGRKLELRLEPGRYLVAESGALIAEVVDKKRTPAHYFVGVNSGFNHLIRPAFYGSYHHIFNLTNPKGKTIRATVVGNMCESSDVFAAKRTLPDPHPGDILLFADAGAYGYVMSSDYNLRKKPKEIILS